ncbi:hypothetical protein FIBSPDRAFT_880533 [Athelia psychrophila]|uniref:Uncharacterized protein n=1 Tax=Athelia psychrophila TaxID=1759441 RepID=A0A167SRD8_9AGAM|nr:hypothetical protein FIBSPDRAFT_880533 [Fibularhizoctonia sp. CBS 109695]
MCHCGAECHHNINLFEVSQKSDHTSSEVQLIGLLFPYVARLWQRVNITLIAAAVCSRNGDLFGDVEMAAS